MAFPQQVKIFIILPTETRQPFDWRFPLVKEELDLHRISFARLFLLLCISCNLHLLRSIEFKGSDLENRQVTVLNHVLQRHDLAHERPTGRRAHRVLEARRPPKLSLSSSHFSEEEQVYDH